MAGSFDQVPVRDSAGLDAFGRGRVSQPANLFDSKLTYDLQPLLWETATTGAGTCTHLPGESAARLRVGTAPGDKVVRQSRQYAPYRPGKSQQILITGVLGDPKTGVRQRLGYFDDVNGIFFEQTATGPAVVIRSGATGTPTDTRIMQSDWNLDPCDGTQPSRIDVDWTKAQVFIIDLAWLGVSRVRMGVVIDGLPVYFHEWLHANNYLNAAGDPGVYMTDATLPCRYEIENVAAAASNTDMLQICASVASEGGEPVTSGLVWTAANGTTLIPVTTRRPILSIRPAATFGGRTNRIAVVPQEASIYCEGSYDVYYEIVRGGTLTGASFAAVAANSAAERDVAATAISGGEVIFAGYAPGGGVKQGSLASRSYADLGVLPLPLTLDIAGTNPIPFTVVATSVPGNSASVAATLTWTEIR